MGQIGRNKNRNRNLVREGLHGKRDTDASIAMADQNHPLIFRNGGHELNQRLNIFGYGTDIVELLGIDTGSAKVQSGDMVAGQFEKGHKFVPAPCSMTSSMNQHEVMLLHVLHFNWLFHPLLQDLLVLLLGA